MMTISRSMRWTEHVAGMGVRNAFKILIVEAEVRKPL
jgi:hypothetical protein